MSASLLKKSEKAPLVIRYRPYGEALALFTCHASEVVISGPAGTGKSRACLEKLHLCAAKYPNVRILMLRKSLASLKTSGLVTMDLHIRPQLDGVVFRGETAKRSPEYRYPNGSVIILGGLDKPSKVMSAEYDIIYVQECTELSENEWESLSTRLRNGKMPYQQLLGDCNPDAPTHWLKLRADAGRCLMLESRHEDNPTVTLDYLARLDALTGVRLLRLRYGVWAAAEGMVYQDAWDRRRNLIDRFPIPREWPRYLSIDFGFTNPFVCQWWAEDPDGRLFRYREIYKTKTLVEDHARTIQRVSRWGEQDGEPLPRAIICDPSAAEAKAQLRQHLGMSVWDAPNDVLAGIQCVAARLRPAGDDKPRLVLLRDSLVERDPLLAEVKRPTCTEEEIESYIWQNGTKEAPVKENDHGCDTMRYMAAYRDLRPSTITLGPMLF